MQTINEILRLNSNNSKKKIKAFYDEERMISSHSHLLPNAKEVQNDGKITATIIEINMVVEVQIHNNGKRNKRRDFETILISSISLK
jgi:hypothetical protein